MAEFSSIQAMQQTGTEAVKRLRKQKFARGLPFMINSKELHKDESYLEYPDGRIVLVKLSDSQSEFTVVKEITEEASVIIRLHYQLD